MPYYEWQGADPFRLGGVGGGEVEPGEVVELPEHVGEPQKEMARVEPPESEADEEAESDASDTTETETADGSEQDDAEEEEAAESGEQDADAFDVEAVREEHWQTVVNAIEAGEYDGHLDELAEYDDRNSVQEAIESRQADPED